MHTQSPAPHHGWPWLCMLPPSSPPLRLALDLLLFFSSFCYLPYSSSSSLAAPPAGIQSDSDPKWSSSCFFPASCCHGTVQSDLLYPSLMGLSSKGSLDFAGLGSPCSWAPPLFLLLDVALLHSWPPHLCDWQFHLVVEESLVPSLAPPFSLLSKSVWVAFWRHYSLFFLIFLSSMCCSFLPSFLWADIVCTGDDFRDFRAAYSLGATDCVSGFPPFGQLFYGGLAGPRYLLEENIWEDSECWLAACLSFVSRGLTKSWVGQVASRSPINRHALDLAVSLDD